MNPDFLTLNGHAFARTSKLATETLFRPIEGRTACGTYRVRSNGILFSDLAGEPRLFLVANRHGERFFVSCHRDTDGRTRYMHSTSTTDERAFSFPESYAEGKEIAHTLWNQVKPKPANQPEPENLTA